MFIEDRGKYVNLDHVSTADVIESRGKRAVMLRDRSGRELATVSEHAFKAAISKEPKR